jgi:2-(1,2-epoxy-1,2-dihydrophenyl)acetyl-CoA isomerase
MTNLAPSPERKVLFAMEGGIARITFNQLPFNTIDLEAIDQFADAANQCAASAGLRVVVLTGSGDRAFCAGGDVRAFARDPDNVDRLVRDMASRLHTAISRLAWLRAPVVAAVNGVAAGAGLSLVAACDLAIASSRATFTSAYTRIGLSPDGSSSWFLPRLIGRRRAMHMYMNNPVLNAATALDWGLLNEVVAPEDFEAAVEDQVRRLADGPTRAYAGVKELLMQSGDSLESQMERETRTIARLSRSPDGMEGVRAFVEKRSAQYQG